jgi:alkanesulfonate monooxygenase SsuD/methylene tetrahydromethanopterin reductase-like flavin-dependent oxidoreductase (luciferase family)
MTSFGLAVPHSICGFDSTGRPILPLGLGDWLEVLEAAGVDAVWVLDQPTGRMATPEPLTLLSYLAPLTSRVRLGAGVLVGPARGPVPLAKSIATLDWLTGGRVDVGLGLGSPRAYPAFGVDRRRGGGQGAILDELIEVLDRLWSHDDVGFAGRTWTLEGVSVNPKPLQRPRPPLWIGGGSEAALRRALRLGGRWIGAGRSTAAEFAALARRLRELQAEMADPVDVTVAKRVYVAVDSDRAAAERGVREWFDAFYGRPEWGPDVSVFGTGADVRAALEELVVAGADHLLLHPVVDHVDHYRRVLGEVVEPLLC